MGNTINENQKKEIGVTNAFRFINYADPALIVSKPLSIYGQLAITPELTSIFNTAVANTTTPETTANAITQALLTFTPIKSSREVIALNPSLYNFSQFSAQFSSKTTDEELDRETKKTGTLSDAQLSLLWDNLYYQAIKNGSTLVADSIISMIRANAFSKEYSIQNRHERGSEGEENVQQNYEKLYRISNANVIIPSKLVVRERASNLTPQKDLDAHSKQELQKRTTADKARYHISILENMVDEVQTAQIKYREENAAAYKVAYATYQAAIDALPAPIEGQPDPEIPKFVFTPKAEFDTEFLAQNLSTETKAYTSKIKKRTHHTFADLETALQGELRKQYSKLAANAPKASGKVLFYDMEIPVNNNPKNNSYIISSEPKLGSDDLHQVFVTHFFESPETAITAISVETTDADGVLAKSKVLQPVYKTENHATFLLFENGAKLSETGHNILGKYEVETKSHSREFALQDFHALHPWFGSTYFDTPIIDTFNDADPGNIDTQLYGVKRIGIMEYKRVEQKICCYVAGEVSHIENIMAREYKERESRSLTSSDIVQEDTKEKESESTKDTTSTDRHEMNKEISQVLQEEKERQIGINAGASGYYHNGDSYGVDVFANTNMNFTNSASSTNSFNVSESFAKEIVERATQRIVEKVTDKRTSRMLREFEETNRHGFDNRLGEKHVTGIYRWVDKIYDNILMNYGKRLLYDFMVPEPSKNFKKWMTTRDASKESKYLIAPKPLSDFGINPQEINSLTELNYAAAAAEYGVEVESCPSQFVNVGKSISENAEKTGIISVSPSHSNWKASVSTTNDEIEIPDGYVCGQVRVVGSQEFYGDSSWTLGGKTSTMHISVGSDGFQRTGTSAFNETLNMDWIEQKLPVALRLYCISQVDIALTAYCVRKPETLLAWKQNTLSSILSAYKKKLEEYNNAMTVVELQNQQTNSKIDYRFNPLMGRAIEQRELKRLCMELMLAPFGITIGQENYKDDPCYNNFDINRNQSFETHASYVKFMEEAFSWDLISYYFYPYYWANEAEWINLIKESSSSDNLFQTFLQSGMARVTVPVRPNFEYAVVFLLNTGKIWRNNKVEIGGVNDDLYLSISDLLKVEQGIPEAKWHTRIPSDLVIIQSDSAPLDEEGLPCKYETKLDGTLAVDKDGNHYYCEDGSPIATGNNILIGQTTNTANPENCKCISCDDIKREYDKLVVIVDATLATFIASTDKDSIKEQTIVTMVTQGAKLGALITNAELLGCNTDAMYAKIDDVKATIKTITQEEETPTP